MPARSEAQRRYLNARFGHAWVKAHGFDNRGRLPARVGRKRPKKKKKRRAAVKRKTKKATRGKRGKRKGMKKRMSRAKMPRRRGYY